MTVIDDIRRYLATELRVANTQTIEPDTPLLQRGIIDSLDLTQLVMFLESRYEISVDDTEVLPKNFRSLAAIEAFVARKREAARR